MRLRSSFNLLLILLLAVSFYGYYEFVIKYEDQKVVFPVQSKEIPLSEEIQELFIYYPEKSGEKLSREKIIFKYNGKRKDFVKNSFKEIKQKGNNIIGESVELRDVFFEGENAYINVNSEFAVGMTTPNKELVLIYSLVNTITQHENITKVKFLIDNMESKTMGGHIKSSVFFEFEDVLLEGE